MIDFGIGVAIGAIAVAALATVRPVIFLKFSNWVATKLHL